MIQKLNHNSNPQHGKDVVSVDADKFANNVDLTPFSIQH